MTASPGLFLDRLSLALRDSHALDQVTLRPIPGGSAARCFDITTPNSRYFLKCWPDTEAGRRHAAQLDAVLPAVRFLADARLDWVVPPLPGVNDAVVHVLDGEPPLPFVLFPYVEGMAATEPMSAEIAAVMGQLLAELHRSGPVVEPFLPPANPYDLGFIAALRQGMTRLSAATAGRHPAIGSLRSVLIERETEARQQIARVESLGAELARRHVTLVPFHTDLGGDNLICRPDGRVAVVDWDGLSLAPPEHDLVFAAGDEHFPALLAAYRSSGGVHGLSFAQVDFALRRRALAAITARILRILEEHSSTDEDTVVTFGVEAYGVANWRAVESTLSTINPLFY